MKFDVKMPHHEADIRQHIHRLILSPNQRAGQHVILHIQKILPLAHVKDSDRQADRQTCMHLTWDQTQNDSAVSHLKATVA